MRISEKRLLLNAEPFGFGPAAAIASFFPYLRERFETVSYVGSGHTLDLQERLPYDHVHPLARGKDAEDDGLEGVLEGYDILLTALDFSVAERAKKKGLDVIVYDPLAWYWKTIPDLAARADLYIAQDFFGVRERLERDSHRFPRTVIVPPIVERGGVSVHKEHVLVNLGGLRNPFMALHTLVDYARMLVDAVERALPGGERLVVSTSSQVARALDRGYARTHSKSEIEGIIARSKYAFMTPGLGNMYDAARHAVPTVWLPPANDSQGRQLKLIEADDFSDCSLDWPYWTGRDMDYSVEQEGVLKRITGVIEEAVRSSGLRRGLEHSVRQAIELVNEKEQGKARGLIVRFGTGGALRVSELVHAYALEEVDR